MKGKWEGNVKECLERVQDAYWGEIGTESGREH